MDLTIILTIGKYAMLVAIYAFVLVVFRGIISQLAAESRRGREAEAGAARSGKSSSRRGLVRLASDAAPSPRAKPEPAVRPSPQPDPPPPVEPEEPSQPRIRPAAASVPRAPERAVSRIDLLGEAEDVVEVAPLSASEPEAPPVSDSPRAADQPASPHLLVLESAAEELEAGDTIGLSAAVTIGRSEENSLQVGDRFISSRHALVCLRDGRRILVDRGSTNGTFVNGDRVENEVELCDGDRIALGNTVLEYHAG